MGTFLSPALPTCACLRFLAFVVSLWTAISQMCQSTQLDNSEQIGVTETDMDVEYHILKGILKSALFISSAYIIYIIGFLITLTR